MSYVSYITKNHFHPGGMAASGWTCSISAVKDTLEADYTAPRVNTTCRVAYRPPIDILLSLLALLVSNFKKNTLGL